MVVSTTTKDGAEMPDDDHPETHEPDATRPAGSRPQPASDGDATVPADVVRARVDSTRRAAAGEPTRTSLPGDGIDTDDAGTDATDQFDTSIIDKVFAEPGGETTRRRLPVQLAAGLDKFEFGPVVGHGGMGVVRRAADVELRRDCAIKQLHKPDNPRAVAAFLDEAQITGQLEHPGVVPVHELGTDAHGKPWLAMKLVEGRTLAEQIPQWHAGGRLGSETLNQILDVFLKVCDAVAFAHARGVIHRDLKPSNIMLGEFGEVLVMDWGLAKPVADRGDVDTPEDESPSTTEAEAGGASDTGSTHGSGRRIASTRRDVDAFRTRVGQVVGTPAYMAPEQARAEPEAIGVRTDVFGLGALLYAMLAGAGPYDGTGPTALVSAAARGAVIDIRRRGAAGRAVNRELAAIVMHATAADADQRYPSARELAGDVRAFRAHKPTAAYDAPVLDRVRKVIRRHPTSALISTVCIGFLAVLAAVIIIARQEQLQIEADQAQIATALAEEAKRNERLENQRVREQLRAERLAREKREAELRAAAQAGEIAKLAGMLNVEYRAVRDAAANELLSRWRDALAAGMSSEMFVTRLSQDERDGYVAAFERLFGAHAEYPDAVPVLATDYLLYAYVVGVGNREPGRALEILGQVDSDGPYGFMLSNARATMLSLAGRTAEAVAAAENTVEMVSADLVNALGNRAAFRARNRELDRAIDDYTRALELAPDSPQLYFNRGIAYARMNNAAAAIDDFTRAIDRRPNYIPPHFTRGSLYMRTGRFDDAVADFTVVIEAGDDKVRFERASAQLRARRPAEALADAEALAAAADGDADAHLRAAAVFQLLADAVVDPPAEAAAGITAAEASARAIALLSQARQLGVPIDAVAAHPILGPLASDPRIADPE
jgi:serine/threonine protein kinase/tetratricopeptide (TPR) repeat protein